MSVFENGVLTPNAFEQGHVELSGGEIAIIRQQGRTAGLQILAGDSEKKFALYSTSLDEGLIEEQDKAIISMDNGWSEELAEDSVSQNIQFGGVISAVKIIAAEGNTKDVTVSWRIAL